MEGTSLFILLSLLDPMTFQDLDVVRLTKAVPGTSLNAGQVGAVVMVFAEPNVAYEVEFCNADGETVDMVPLTPDYLELALNF